MATLNTKIVLRNDTAANWALHNPTLLEGEMGVETDTGLIKVGKGDVAWNDLAYVNKFESVPVAAHYEAIATAGQTDEAAIAAALLAANATAKLDDVAVVKRLINGDKYQHTAYIFNGTSWAAMDGNYNAENVYFDEDITITTAVGNIKLENGSAEIPATGKNIKQVFQALWTKENYNPTVTNPKISLSVKNANGKTSVEGEVGTTFEAPTATASISDFGSFQFGSKDADGKFYAADAASDVVFSTLKVGAAATAAALTEENSTSITDINSAATTKSVSYGGLTGTFTNGAQTQKFSASATHGGSVRKGVSNLGNFVNAAGNASVDNYTSAGKDIAANAGTMAINGTGTFTATGFYAWFAGGVDRIPAQSELTGAWLRENLENKGKYAPLGTKASGAKPTLQITPGPDGDKCYIIAVPGTAKEYLSLVELSSSLYMDITGDYTANKFTTKIPDAAGVDSTVSYTVYWYKPAALGADETHDIYMV